MALVNGYHDVPPGKIAMVVTHLEMTAPARRRDAALPGDLVFAPLPRETASYRDLFYRIGADWLWTSRLVMPEAKLAEILVNPDVEIFTLLKDNRPEALLELDFREPGACELAFFGVTPALIGAGAGAFLMDRAIERAWARPIERFHVHTCTLDSPAALEFYRRSGFDASRRQVEILDDPRLLGVYPEEAASHVPLL